jgi:pimeloyl-ACP methyl ester carboxylesterase
MPASTFGLVHGAWHGGWVWSTVKTELEARGHHVVAPDLPSDDIEAGTLEYGRVVEQALCGHEDAILVGHSLGGLTIALLPARLHVYVAAYVPRPRLSLADLPPEAFGPGFGDSRVRDELERSYWPDPVTAARDLQYPPAAAQLARRLRHQARKPSAEVCPVATLPSVPSVYIVCGEDTAIPPSWQRKVAREELGVVPIELDSGHSPMLSVPGELAEILDRLAAA